MSDRRIVLVTGANTGIGYQIVRSLGSYDRSYEILLGGRSIEKAKKAAEDARTEFADSQSRIHPVQIDIQDDDSITALFNEVKDKFGKLDVLINNAGALFDIQYATGAMTMREAWTKSWDVNVTSTHVITHSFIPLLLESDDPRIVFLASGMSSLSSTESPHNPGNAVPPKGWPKPAGLRAALPAYSSAKTGLAMMMREWHKMLKEDGVKVWAVSPGFLATSLGGGSPEAMEALGAVDAAIGGQLIKGVVEGVRDADVGRIVAKDNVQSW